MHGKALLNTRRGVDGWIGGLSESANSSDDSDEEGGELHFYWNELSTKKMVRYKRSCLDDAKGSEEWDEREEETRVMEPTKEKEREQRCGLPKYTKFQTPT